VYELAKASKSTILGIAVFEELSPHAVGEFARVRLGSLKGYFLAERDEVVKARKCLDDLLAASAPVRKSSWDEIRLLRLLLASAYGRKGDFDAAEAQLKEQAAVLRTRGEWNGWATCLLDLANMTPSAKVGLALFDRLAPFAKSDEAKCALLTSKGAFLCDWEEVMEAEKCLTELLGNPILKDRPWDDSIRWFRWELCRAYMRIENIDGTVAHLREVADDFGWQGLAGFVGEVGCGQEALKLLQDTNAKADRYLNCAEALRSKDYFWQAITLLRQVPQNEVVADSEISKRVAEMEQKILRTPGEKAKAFKQLAEKAIASGDEVQADEYFRRAKAYRHQQTDMLKYQK